MRVVTAVLLVIFGILPRIQARTALRQETARMAVPTVAVVQPKRSAPAQEIVLPANVQAFADAPIYARTNGYLKRWYVDIGGHVKEGQLLAEIDTPEVNQQLRQARADLATAQANLNLSKITADRYAGLLKTDSVSKQESDNAAGDYEAKQASVAVRASQREAAGRVAIVSKDLCSVLRRDYGAQYRYWRLDRFRQQRRQSGLNCFTSCSPTSCASTSACPRSTPRPRSQG